MLTAPLLVRRSTRFPLRWPTACRQQFNASKSTSRDPPKIIWQPHKHAKPPGRQSVTSSPPLQSTKNDDATPEPSLVEQLFPEETKRYNENQTQTKREIPRLPLYDPATDPPKSPRPRLQNEDEGDNQPPTKRARSAKMQIQDDMHTFGPRLTLLVLRNASPNLVLEDFRRLIPQGKHVEGWALEQGDIIQVIPGRNLATLEQCTYYYLLFASQLSAFTYQGHATRISQLAAAQTPVNVTSAIPPPAGYMINGFDARAAIDSFALIPATQKLDLRQLKPPLAPLLAAIVQHRGYPSIVNRPGKLPHELRLTLEGPQLQMGTLRHIFLLSAQDRGAPWSGGDEQTPRMTDWDPSSRFGSVLSPQDSSSEYALALERRGATSLRDHQTEDIQMERDLATLQHDAEVFNGEENEQPASGMKRRTHQNVFILGFYTENAAEAFRRFWHRRPMTWKGFNRRAGGRKEVVVDEEDLPPIANLDTLW